MLYTDKSEMLRITSYTSILIDFITKSQRNKPFLFWYASKENHFLRILELFVGESLKIKREAYQLLKMFLINPREDSPYELVSLIKENKNRIQKALEEYMRLV